MSIDSCLVAKLSHYIDLSREHKKLLEVIERSEQSCAPAEDIFTIDQPVRHLFAVRSGWLFAYTHLPDGGRHITRLYHAGDIIGLSSLAQTRYATSVRACAEAIVCPFEKSDLDRIFTGAPRIAALLTALASREQVLLRDLLRATSRMNPRARLAYFLLNILSRLRVTNGCTLNYMRMPLTQQDIGDAVGLTNVTVSRAMGSMEADGLIVRDPPRLTIVDEDALTQLCEFEDRHFELDTHWFPDE